MKRLLLALAFVCLALPASAACVSPITGNDAGGTSRTFGVTLDAATNCYGNVALVDGANAANKVTVTAANALKVDGSAVTQPVSLTSTTITGTVAATQSGNWTARVVGNAGAVLDFAGQNAASPANALLGGCQFNTSPTTISSGNASPVQCTNGGAVLTNVVNTNANGQGTMANSSPVVIASNQSNLPTNTAQVNGVTVLTGTGATGTGAQRMTVSTDQATNAGAALAKGGVGVVNGGSFYQHVAASQTGAVLQSSTGAIGDYLSHCVIYPGTTAAGSVTVFDNTNAAATNVIEFTTGTLSNLAPIAIPVGAVSTAGAWKVTTGANETVVCFGKFS